ncbi:ATP-binding protein [Nonomuraea sp. NPDC050790]|uniref:sensor histidine kinase n=1 Tax=Nonomuraea sp. NPDC050790 TaxID=3364371 RepID=UPI0037B012C9
MNLHPLPPAKAPTGVGRLPVARWFIAAGVVTALAYAAGVGATLTMVEQVRAIRPRPDVVARLDQLNLILILVFTIILLAGVALTFVIRYAVLKPIAQLAGQVREVAAGDFNRRLRVDRPAELAELASHVDSMRARILDGWRTAEEQADELRRSNGELEQFAYVASHDLQEPLRKVASFTQMLEQRYGPQLDDRAKQYIGYAVDGAKRMQVLINDLLDFSRVGRVHGERVVTDTGEALQSALDNLSAAIEDTGTVVTSDRLPKVVGNRSQLVRLFQNLVENSIRFRSELPPRIHIGAQRADNGMWELSCSDNGIGVEAKYAERIFLIFQRLHPRDVYPGTGIGLALCRKIVEYHGGMLWLDSERSKNSEGAEAHGATFRWTLPDAEEDA